MATVPINDVTPLNQYVSAAGQTQFPYSFWISEDDDIQVFVNDDLKVLGVDYTVTGALNTSGGDVIFTSGLALNDAVTLSRNIPIDRITEFATSGALRAEALNLEQSKEIAISQQLKRDINRSVKLSPTSTINPDNVIWPEPVDGRAVLFDGTTGSLRVSNDNVDGITDSAAASAAAAAASAAAALVSEGNASSSASSASTSASNAATSEGNAATSEINSAANASSAASSAAIALAAESNASASAANALTSASNAATSEANAATSETNAAASEANALSSASSASTSASNAATSASNAATSEANAAASAAAAEVAKIEWQGDWNIATAYNISDAVFHLGSSYIAITNNTGSEPSDVSTDWDLLASKGDALGIEIDNFVSGIDFTGGVTTQLTLSADPGDEQNLNIFFDGLKQQNTEFTYLSSVVTFSSPIPVGVQNIEIQIGVAKDATAIAEGSITTAKLADNAVTLDKMASGTAGELITYDVAGNPAKVAVGTAGQVLTSNGAGSAPTMEDAPVSPPGGSTNQVQYNNAGVFGGISNGSSGQVLTSNGTSSLPTFQTINTPVANELAKAWVNFNGIGTVSIRDSFNVSSITDLGTGIYQINFSGGTFANSNYVPQLHAPMELNNQQRHVAQVRNTSAVIGRATLKNTGAIQVTYSWSTISYQDPEDYYAVFFGD